MFKDLTPDRLCEILGIENKEQDLGLSIRASVRFFEKFILNLIVVNIYDEVIFKGQSIPAKNDPYKIAPSTLHILVYNNHCFKLNSRSNSLIQKLNNKDVMGDEKKTYENLNEEIPFQRF